MHFCDVLDEDDCPSRVEKSIMLFLEIVVAHFDFFLAGAQSADDTWLITRGSRGTLG